MENQCLFIQYKYSPCTENFYISTLSNPTSYIQHPTSNILHKILSNPILSYPILSSQTKTFKIILVETMITNDSIIYLIGHLCNKERVYTTRLFFVSLKPTLVFMQDRIR